MNKIHLFHFFHWENAIPRMLHESIHIIQIKNVTHRNDPSVKDYNSVIIALIKQINSFSSGEEFGLFRLNGSGSKSGWAEVERLLFAWSLLWFSLKRLFESEYDPDLSQKITSAKEWVVLSNSPKSMSMILDFFFVKVHLAKVWPVVLLDVICFCILEGAWLWTQTLWFQFEDGRYFLTWCDSAVEEPQVFS